MLTCSCTYKERDDDATHATLSWPSLNNETVFKQFQEIKSISIFSITVMIIMNPWHKGNEMYSENFNNVSWFHSVSAHSLTQEMVMKWNHKRKNKESNNNKVMSVARDSKNGKIMSCHSMKTITNDNIEISKYVKWNY